MANVNDQQNTDYDYLIKFLALGDSGEYQLNFVFIFC